MPKAVDCKDNDFERKIKDAEKRSYRLIICIFTCLFIYSFVYFIKFPNTSCFLFCFFVGFCF